MAALRNFNGLALSRIVKNSLQPVNLTMPSRDFAPVHDPGRPVAPRHWRRIRCWPHTLNNEGVSERSVGRWRGSKQPTHLPSQWVLSTTIRASVTPRANSYCATGATGKVFGFLSTAFSVGGVVTPVIFGWILDNAGALDVLANCRLYVGRYLDPGSVGTVASGVHDRRRGQPLAGR